MTPSPPGQDDLDAAQAKIVQDTVTRTAAAYKAATAERMRVFRALKAGGRSFYWIAKSAGVSTTRVVQLLEPPQARRADDKEAGA